MQSLQRTFKAISYNVFIGGELRLDGIAKLIQRGNYHFAAFSELNNFTKTSFREWASSELGLEFTEFLQTPHGFHLGIASRYRLHLLKHDTGYPFHHGYLLTWIEELKCCVLVTHLCPLSSSRRLEEVENIMKVLSGLPLDKKSIILMGDLNTLSSRDTITNEMLQTFDKNSKLKKKYLCDQSETSLCIDFRPMNTLNQSLADIGIVDDYSVPTLLREDEIHATQLRIDYALVSESFQKEYNALVTAATIKSEETNILSDHYPLEITFSKK